MAKTTTYQAKDKKAGMTVEEIAAIMSAHPSTAHVRAETGFGGIKPGGPIKTLIVEEA